MAFRRSGSDRIFWLFGSSVPQFDGNGNIIRVITSFADVTEMKNAERAIHSLSTQLLKLQDEERRRIGRELHDGLAQTVLAINLSLAQVRQSLSSPEEVALRSLDRARALTLQMSREIRTLSYLLHPPLLDDLGLVSALKEYVHGFSERSGIKTELLAQTDCDRLAQPLEIAFFRIVQESLANIQRHSGSATAQIRLTQKDSLLTLEVADQGHGIQNTARLPQSNPVIPSEVLEPRNPWLDTPPLQALSLERLSESGSWGNPLNASPPDALTSTTHNSAIPGHESPSTNHDAPVPTHEPRIPTLGVGIPGMRERMSQLGGRLEIISGPTGTTIRATISLPPSASTEPLHVSSSYPDRG